MRPAAARMMASAIAVVAAVVAWPAIAHVLMQSVGAPGSVTLRPPEPAQGWLRDASALSDWTPDLEGARDRQAFVYRKGKQRVAVVVAAYQHQTQAAQVGSTANQLARTTNQKWKQTSRGSERVASVIADAVADPVHTAELRGPIPSDRLLVWHYYWTASGPTSSAARTKLELARARLLRQPDTALWIALYAPADESREAAQRALQEFTRDMGPSLQRTFFEAVAP